MHQDSYFSYTSSEEFSDPPQLPFPEPGQTAAQAISAAPDALQIPFPIQQSTDGAYGSTQIPFPQSLPSTDTIDTTHIRFLQLLPMTGTDEMGETGESAQIPFSRQHGETSKIMQIPQMPFAQQPALNGTSSSIHNPLLQQIEQPGAAAQPSLVGAGNQVTMPMPGLIEIPLVMQARTATALTEQEDIQGNELAPSNQEAKRAIINGVISFVVSIFTLTTVAGFAGLIIGTFAIIYGLKGLRLAQYLPNKAGRGQAIIGIALGLLAWSIVLAAIIFRVPQSR